MISDRLFTSVMRPCSPHTHDVLLYAAQNSAFEQSIAKTWINNKTYLDMVSFFFIVHSQPSTQHKTVVHKMRCTNSNILVLFCCKRILTIIHNCIYFRKAKVLFYFCTETHSVSLTWLHQHYCAVETTHSFFACTFGQHHANFSTSCIDMWGCVWMSHFSLTWICILF